jgi:putative ABC transport system permease protein
MAYTVSLRTHEIGIRVALGAAGAQIVKMVLKKGLGLIVVGLGIGVAASLALRRFIASQIGGVSTNDPWTFSAVVTLVTIAGLGACLLPARRAAKLDPLVALRYE